jgi:hypothetical protein
VELTGNRVIKSTTIVSKLNYKEAHPSFAMLNGR